MLSNSSAMSNSVVNIPQAARGALHTSRRPGTILETLTMQSDAGELLTSTSRDKIRDWITEPPRRAVQPQNSTTTTSTSQHSGMDNDDIAPTVIDHSDFVTVTRLHGTDQLGDGDSDIEQEVAKLRSE